MKSLTALILQARAEGKWLWVSYQDLWFTPDELARDNARGAFRWAPENFRLRDPSELLDQANWRVEAAVRERDSIMVRIAREHVP